MGTIIQVYLRKGLIRCTGACAEIVNEFDFESRRQRSLDRILEGTERLYRAKLNVRKIIRNFAIKVAEFQSKFLLEDGYYDLWGEEGHPIGIHYSFLPELYRRLNIEIRRNLDVVPVSETLSQKVQHGYWLTGYFVSGLFRKNSAPKENPMQ